MEQNNRKGLVLGIKGHFLLGLISLSFFKKSNVSFKKGKRAKHEKSLLF